MPTCIARNYTDIELLLKYGADINKLSNYNEQQWTHDSISKISFQINMWHISPIGMLSA